MPPIAPPLGPCTLGSSTVATFDMDGNGDLCTETMDCTSGWGSNSAGTVMESDPDPTTCQHYDDSPVEGIPGCYTTYATSVCSKISGCTGPNGNTFHCGTKSNGNACSVLARCTPSGAVGFGFSH